MNDTALKKIENILDNYLSSRFDCELLEFDTDFYCFPNTREIAIALTYSENADIEFNKLFQRLGLKYSCDPFILAFYHEIGHCMTWDYFNSFDKFIITKGKKIIESTDKITPLRRFVYTNWLDEFCATRWACNYINKHPKEVAKMWSVIQPLILQFYKDNGLV